jgi:hypothetical protein
MNEDNNDQNDQHTEEQKPADETHQSKSVTI